MTGTLERLAPHLQAIATANDEAVARLDAARPVLRGVASAARDVIEDMTPRTFLHAGPPIEWTDMCGPLRGAIAGAAVYEGLAPDVGAAERMAASGHFEFVPCHERGAVGPMAGVVSASMPMLIVENLAYGNRAYCTLNEGLGRVLRYGANDRTVLSRLQWMRDVLAPLLARAVGRLGDPIDIRALTAQAVQMGDDGHNRNRAGTSLLIRELLPALIEVDAPDRDLAAAARFIAGNDHFYLNLTMPMAKAAADAAAGIHRSSVVVAMA